MLRSNCKKEEERREEEKERLKNFPCGEEIVELFTLKLDIEDGYDEISELERQERKGLAELIKVMGIEPVILAFKEANDDNSSPNGIYGAIRKLEPIARDREAIYLKMEGAIVDIQSDWEKVDKNDPKKIQLGGTVYRPDYDNVPPDNDNDLERGFGSKYATLQFFRAADKLPNSSRIAHILDAMRPNTDARTPSHMAESSILTRRPVDIDLDTLHAELAKTNGDFYAVLAQRLEEQKTKEKNFDNTKAALDQKIVELFEEKEEDIENRRILATEKYRDAIYKVRDMGSENWNLAWAEYDKATKPFIEELKKLQKELDEIRWNVDVFVSRKEYHVQSN